MPFGRRAKLTVIVGLSFALLFALLGLGELRRPAVAKERVENALPPPQRLLPVAVALRPIRTGETITADLVKGVSGDPVRDAMSASPGEVIGKVAVVSIPLHARIGRTAVAAEDKLAIRVPVGMRAISINTTDEIAVAGLIRPGDRVDVQTVYPGADMTGGLRGQGRSRAVTLLQLVPVLAVGELVIGMEAQPPATGGSSSISMSASQPQRARTVTLALTPEQVSQLALAKNVGSLYLALRNPADRLIANASATGPAVAAPLAPMAAMAMPTLARSAAPPPSGQPIELIVGDRREIIYSGRGARP